MGIALPPVRAAVLQISMDLQYRQSRDEPDLQQHGMSSTRLAASRKKVLRVAGDDLMAKGHTSANAMLQKAVTAHQKARLQEEGWDDAMQTPASAQYDAEMERCARRTFAAPVLDPPIEHWDISDAQMQTHFTHLCQRPLFHHGAACHHVPRHLATPCRKEADSDGHRAWQCNRAGIRARHNTLARAWRDVCLKAGWDAHVEQEILLPTQDMQVKRADVLITKSDARRTGNHGCCASKTKGGHEHRGQSGW